MVTAKYYRAMSMRRGVAFFAFVIAIISVESFSFTSSTGWQRQQHLSLCSEKRSVKPVDLYSKWSCPDLRVTGTASHHSLSNLNLYKGYDSAGSSKQKGSLFRSFIKVQAPKKVSVTFRKMLQLFSAFFSVFALSTRKSFATTTGLASVKSLTKRSAKPVLATVLLCTIVSALVQQVRVKQRQALDATSEWGRYAKFPAARGRAIMSLCCKLLPLLIASKLSWFISATKRESLRTFSGAVFADNLLKLGPLYVKLGQIVSCREDVLPNEWLKAMEQLQDRVPAKSGDDARELAYSAIGSKEKFDQVFSDFNDVPLAAASLGQVHRATLRDANEVVAIKLQRSNLRTIYDQDLNMMKKISKFMDKIGGSAAQVGGVEQSWYEIFTDAEVILYREIDYRDEAKNGIKFMSDFGIGKNGTAVETNARSRDDETLPSAAQWLRAPYVYEEYCSEQVLVMEYVPSIKITNTAALNAANVTAEGKEYLADCLARSYLRQFCANYLFSTDPHPGNLGVEVFEGSNPPKLPRLVFYDFGQACTLTEDEANGILDVVEAIVDMDPSRCVDAFQTMGVLKPNADLKKVRNKVQNNFDTGKIQVKQKKLKKSGYKFKDPPALDNDALASNTTTKITKESDSEIMSYFTLPAEYAFVARALSQMDGVGKGLDPDFDFISSAAPHLIEIKGTKSYLKDEYTKAVSRVQDSTLEKVYDFFKPTRKRDQQK